MKAKNTSNLNLINTGRLEKLEKLLSFSNSCLKGVGGLFNIFSILGDLRNFWQNIHPWSWLVQIGTLGSTMSTRYLASSSSSLLTSVSRSLLEAKANLTRSFLSWMALCLSSTALRYRYSLLSRALRRIILSERWEVWIIMTACETMTWGK